MLKTAGIDPTAPGVLTGKKANAKLAAATVAALAGIGVMGVRMAVKNAAMMAYTAPEEPLGRSFVHWMLSDFVRIGHAVVGGWIALILIHGWRRERSPR